MTDQTSVPSDEVDALCEQLYRQAEASGYHLNPDGAFTRGLAEGLLINQRRYGYWACPCRLASGEKHTDLDIICPCDYRDADLGEWGSCYCALYVSGEVLRGEREVGPIPERRPAGGPPSQERVEPSPERPGRDLDLPVWRCRVCGYLCAREGPPEVCPICKAHRERFERFW